MKQKRQGKKKQIEVVRFEEYEDRFFASFRIPDVEEEVTLSRWPGTTKVCYYPGWEEMSRDEQKQVVRELMEVIAAVKPEHGNGIPRTM